VVPLVVLEVVPLVVPAVVPLVVPLVVLEVVPLVVPEVVPLVLAVVPLVVPLVLPDVVLLVVVLLGAGAVSSSSLSSHDVFISKAAINVTIVKVMRMYFVNVLFIVSKFFILFYLSFVNRTLRKTI
jgi:hypothetical protein